MSTFYTKARVKATGEIVEVVYNGFYYESIKDEMIFDKSKLEIISKTKDPDYWARLEHQYAGMIVQGMVEHNGINFLNDAILNVAVQKANTLVNKLKEERK